MGETTVTIVGVIIGFLFGLSGIATLFDILGNILTSAQTQISQFGVASTLVLLILAIVLIVKVRAISALVVGAIIGAVLNIILTANGIHLLPLIKSAIMPKFTP